MATAPWKQHEATEVVQNKLLVLPKKQTSFWKECKMVGGQNAEHGESVLNAAGHTREARIPVCNIVFVDDFYWRYKETKIGRAHV